MVMLELMNLLHGIGIAWGVGGVTIIAILMTMAGREVHKAPHLMEAVDVITKLIWAGLIMLIISGIFLVPLVTWPMDRTVLLIKHAVVAALVINGIAMHFLKKHKSARILGPIGLVLWYAVMVLSVVM